MGESLGPSEIVQLAKGTFPLLINSVSAGSLLLWDISITFSEEVELIWKSRLSIVKIVFLIMRYLSLGTQFVSIAVPLMSIETHATCKSYIWFRSFSSAISICTSQILLIYRVLAFYNWNFILQLSLSALFVITNISILVLLVLGVSHYAVITNPIPSLNSILGGCITTSYPKELAFVWIPELIFQSILFILVFSKFAMGYLETWKRRQASQIYKVFIRDGVWVYVIQLAVLLLCVLFNRQASFLGLDFIIWQITVTSICCTRLILNLRSLGRTGAAEQTIRLGDLNSIEFKSRNTSERRLQSKLDVHIEVTTQTVTSATQSLGR